MTAAVMPKSPHWKQTSGYWTETDVIYCVTLCCVQKLCWCHLFCHILRVAVALLHTYYSTCQHWCSKQRAKLRIRIKNVCHIILECGVKLVPYLINERWAWSWSQSLGSQYADDVSHKLGGRQLSTRPMVTFPAKERHCPLAGTGLYCLVTEPHGSK